ncbi:MAG: hypothetical protein P0Y56_12805 [Candidatus Andeanibacterium colombiense]|uniref:DNA binding HTH domain-containing protein n=1 Tax=Candidatus Andeanibacterium colombiense TaxID=3121345 RepID=A0AAJ5X4P0_9SPHN|nr:MAG: hypothetical protein P0Y56_12805 [Sphingomonadaceae bacterium]
MPRPFNRRQALENRAFLAALARTGNARLAARELGFHRSTFTKRRGRDPAFAAEWDAALALAQARLSDRPARRVGEPQVVRLANGRLQLRQPAEHRIGQTARQAFLAALSATANVRLSARAAGFAHSSFYRLRDHDPAFAREMRLALQMGYDRIELALLENMDPARARDDAWRSNDPPPIPPMSAAQAIQLLYLHQKEARLWGTRADRWRRRRGDTDDDRRARRMHKWKAEKAWDREGYEVARAGREGGNAGDLEPPAPQLPALAPLVREDGGKDAGRRALFGGWRLEDWEGR